MTIGRRSLSKKSDIKEDKRSPVELSNRAWIEIHKFFLKKPNLPIKPLACPRPISSLDKSLYPHLHPQPLRESDARFALPVINKRLFFLTSKTGRWLQQIEKEFKESNIDEFLVKHFPKPLASEYLTNDTIRKVTEIENQYNARKGSKLVALFFLFVGMFLIKKGGESVLTLVFATFALAGLQFVSSFDGYWEDDILKECSKLSSTNDRDTIHKVRDCRRSRGMRSLISYYHQSMQADKNVLLLAPGAKRKNRNLNGLVHLTQPTHHSDQSESKRSTSTFQIDDGSKSMNQEFVLFSRSHKRSDLADEKGSLNTIGRRIRRLPNENNLSTNGETFSSIPKRAGCWANVWNRVCTTLGIEVTHTSKLKR
jgi:hypothetical protein